MQLTASHGRQSSEVAVRARGMIDNRALRALSAGERKEEQAGPGTFLIGSQITGWGMWMA